MAIFKFANCKRLPEGIRFCRVKLRFYSSKEIQRKYFVFVIFPATNKKKWDLIDGIDWLFYQQPIILPTAYIYTVYTVYVYILLLYTYIYTHGIYIYAESQLYEGCFHVRIHENNPWPTHLASGKTGSGGPLKAHGERCPAQEWVAGRFTWRNLHWIHRKISYWKLTEHISMCKNLNPVTGIISLG